jgi:hypothetical protein
MIVMKTRTPPFKVLITCLWFCWLVATQPHGHAQDPSRGQSVRTNATEQRLALVIGNSGYKESPLANPVNDARDMAAALRACGFEVLTGEDRNQRQMKELIRQFGQRLRQGGVGLFFFAGHGIQASGRNYLIPLGAEINAAAEIEYEAVEMGFVLAQMEEARNRLNVVILDACRNNPYARSFRSDTRGLASVRNAPSGTLIAYATAADDVAADGSGRNGLFTGELLTHLKQPGLTLEQVFRRTRTNVRSKSGGKQVPYEYSSVEGEDFYFVAPAPIVTVRTDEETAWNYAKRSRTASVVRLFLMDYPNSQQAVEARTLLAELEKLERPPANVTPPGTKPASNVRMSATGVSLTALPTFTTVKVDGAGKVIER